MENNDKNYFLNLLTLNFYNLGKDRYNDKSFIQYLYLPINEVFLFIFGIALISLGYKFKIRIDIFIFAIILIIYLAKIILFFTYLYKEQLYPTLYFYLFGYGELMFNPLFNLPSFLIGMYFGLANFTIQRGLNTSFKDNVFEKMELYDSNRTSAKRESVNNNIKLDNSNSGNEIYYKRILSYKDEIKSPLNNKNESFIEKNESHRIELEGNKEHREDEEFNIKQENKIVKEMPFLKSAIGFINFHRKNQEKKCFLAIIIMFTIIIFVFIFIRFIFIIIYVDKSNDQDNVTIIGNLSFDKVIPNYLLNILYILDIELVVYMIHRIFFYAYFKGGQFNDFFGHIYWSFFIKSYFSYALVSSPIILYIFYQSETVIKVTVYNIILYSLISLFLIFINVIIFYSFYELPFKKIFKKIKLRSSYINLENEDFDEDDDDNYTIKT